MVEVKKNGSDISLTFNEKESNEFGIKENYKYTLIKINNTTFAITTEVNTEKEMENSILILLEEAPFQQKVEGRFEKLLDKKGKEKFFQLLNEGKIIKYKASSAYKMAIYKVANNLNNVINKSSTNSNYNSNIKSEIKNENNNLKEFDLEKNGFIITKNETKARILSEKLKKEIREGLIKGIKSFDGNFYIIQRDIFEKTSQKVLEYCKLNTPTNIVDISKDLGVNTDLLKGTCELLKEEGDMIEKRKGVYIKI